MKFLFFLAFCLLMIGGTVMFIAFIINIFAGNGIHLEIAIPGFSAFVFALLGLSIIAGGEEDSR